MLVEHTGNYMIATDGIGYAIKNVGSRKEVYLQGDDAVALRNFLDQMLTKEQIDTYCSEYDPVMT